MNIFVAKLSSSTTSDDLRGLFEEFGEVSSANVIFDRETGNSKGFGFVEMSDDDEAYNAIDQLNETDFMSRTIVVKKARPRENGGGRPQGGGRFNQNRRY
ncbi:RNA recognition motif domain-containing protein [Roseivirga sp. BDSF3-8]|uniref:RNA recognition motif domain-containing protein n=1 Tax=Roseivirga sp. BDSF3-8 TaxID=3241598 RepID=UPI003531E7A8